MNETEDKHVQSTRLNVNWLNFNMPTIAAIAALGVLFWSSAQKVGEMQAKLDAADQKFSDIKTSIDPLENLPYRTGILEQQATAINLRIDRFTEIITNTMELIRKDVNGLGTKVEVLSEKIDNLTPPTRSGFTP